MPKKSNMGSKAVRKEILNDCNKATESFLDTISIDCDMASELVPKAMEFDH
jgi:hypothetical protein